MHGTGTGEAKTLDEDAWQESLPAIYDAAKYVLLGRKSVARICTRGM